jgi:hypothetical protein
MTRTINSRLSTARKLGFAIVAIGVVTITSDLAAPQQAKAFGIGDVFGVVEDVWEIGADATERAGRVIGKEARKIGRGTITPTGPRARSPGDGNACRWRKYRTAAGAWHKLEQFSADRKYRAAAFTRYVVEQLAPDRQHRTAACSWHRETDW